MHSELSRNVEVKIMLCLWFINHCTKLICAEILNWQLLLQV